MWRIKVRNLWGMHNGPGELFDSGSYAGHIRGIIFCVLGFIFVWNIDSIMQWEHSIFGLEYKFTAGQQRVSRFWAVLICGGGVFFSIVNIGILFYRRRSAIKSAVGQWYDKEKLTSKDLYGDEDK